MNPIFKFCHKRSYRDGFEIFDAGRHLNRYLMWFESIKLAILLTLNQPQYTQYLFDVYQIAGPRIGSILKLSLMFSMSIVGLSQLTFRRMFASEQFAQFGLPFVGKTMQTLHEAYDIAPGARNRLRRLCKRLCARTRSVLQLTMYTVYAWKIICILYLLIGSIHLLFTDRATSRSTRLYASVADHHSSYSTDWPIEISQWIRWTDRFVQFDSHNMPSLCAWLVLNLFGTFGTMEALYSLGFYVIVLDSLLKIVCEITSFRLQYMLHRFVINDPAMIHRTLNQYDCLNRELYAAQPLVNRIILLLYVPFFFGVCCFTFAAVFVGRNLFIRLLLLFSALCGFVSVQFNPCAHNNQLLQTVSQSSAGQSKPHRCQNS